MSVSLSLGEEKKEMGARRGRSSTDWMFGWLRRQPMKVKIFLAVSFSVFTLVALKRLVKNYDYFFVASEAVHFAGIMVLIYKLTTKKNCSGLSLKTQELTAVFLSVRFIATAIFETDIHAVLDFLTLVSTAWVIYMMRCKLKSTYMTEQDNMPRYYILVPCSILSLFIHPHNLYVSLNKMVWVKLWAFAGYLESVSVLPQLRMMQNAKMIEPFTSHYVFALGIARFFGCVHWIFRVYESGGAYLQMIGHGYLWLLAVVLSEMVQTFILADFCYYYIKSLKDGQLIMRMPV